MSASWKEGASLLCKDRSIKFLGSGYMRESLQHLKPHKKQTPGTKIIVLATLSPNHPFSCSFQESFAWFAALATLSGTPYPDKGLLEPRATLWSGATCLFDSVTLCFRGQNKVFLCLISSVNTSPNWEWDHITDQCTSVVANQAGEGMQEWSTGDRPNKGHPRTANISWSGQ